MKIATTGASGKIGSRLVALGAIPLHFDLMDKDAIGRELFNVAPNVVIHTAALTDVEECEKDYNRAILVNVRGTNNLCEEMSRIFGDGNVVVLSSDHVFNGRWGNYREKDKPSPINQYGFTKWGAESVADVYKNKVIRISSGVSARIYGNIHRLLFDLRSGFMVDVPTFIQRSYCHLDFLAESIWWCANGVAQLPPILHVAGSRAVSQYDFFKMVAKELGCDPNLVIPRRQEKQGFAPRPHKGGLNVSLAKKLGVPVFTPEQTIEKLKNEYDQLPKL